MTLGRVTARHPWLIPTAVVAFLALATGAIFNTLPWDEPITRWVVDARTPWLNEIVRRVSFLGSTPVVLTVAGVGALLALKKCPRLAMAIVVIALARPATEWLLKELVSRPRPSGDRMVNGAGYSFPSGHPMATAASWALLPLVAALYTKRRVLWWTIAIGSWSLVVLVAVSRVWLGVHYTSDVVASVALAVIGVAAAERFMRATHPKPCCDEVDEDESAGRDAVDVDLEVVDAPVLQTAT